jgi:site-specific DNA-adenine methylase
MSVSACLGDALLQCYCAAMTREQIDSVLERVRSWPQEDQQELAELIREIEARRTGVYILNNEEREAIAKARRDIRVG